MTVVDHTTGEVIEPKMSEKEARRTTTAAQVEFRSAANHFKAGWTLVELAVRSGGYLSLGYRSPGDYLRSEFDGILSNLDVPERRLAVREMSALGQSTRAIGSVLGVNHSTVVRDQRAGGADAPPRLNPNAQAEAKARIEAREDKARERAHRGLENLLASRTPQGQDHGEAPAISEDPEPAPAVVIGIDGKRYSRPEPKPVLADSSADYDNAEKASKSLSNAIAKLLEFQHPNMREAMCRYWSMASKEVPPTPRRDVTPEQMRVAAQGLLALADEWSTK